MTRKFLATMSLLAVLAPVGASANNLHINTQTHIPVRPHVQINRPIHIDVKPRIHRDIGLHTYCASEAKRLKLGIIVRVRHCRLGG